MSLQRRRPMIAAAILETHNNTVLIVRPRSEHDRAPKDDPGAERMPWQFPRGIVDPEETAEAGMRRIAWEQLGIKMEIVVGQPPFVHELDGREHEVRFFIGGILSHREPARPHYAEDRWIQRGHLREYDFDELSQPVAKWFLGED